MDEQQMREIRERTEATPAGYWHPVLGSGHNAMTAIATEDDQGQTTFIADLYPDYIVEMPQGERVWQNRTALLAFLSHARADTLALLDALAARDAELARIRRAISSVEWLENEICTSDSTRYICPFCLHYSASNAHNPAGHYPDCVIALAEPPPGDGAGDGIDWKASYHEAHAEANAWKELLDYRAAEADRLREALEPFAAIDTGETDCPDHFTQEETLTVGSIRRARAALDAEDKESPHAPE